MNTAFVRYGLALACVVSVLAPVSAHQMWVGANKFNADVPGRHPGPVTITVFAGWGHRLPVDEMLDAGRFGGFTLVGPDGSRRKIESESGGFWPAAIAFEKAGLYWVVSENKPGFSTQVRGEDGRMQYLRVPKDELPPGVRAVDSTYIHGYTKTLLNLRGAGATDAPATRALGHRLEIVPGESPASLKSGDTLPLQVLFDGGPRGGGDLVIDAVHAAADVLGARGAWQAPVPADGRVAMPVAAPGLWQLVVTVTLPPEGELKGKVNQVRHRATLTFEVPFPPADS